MELVNFSVTNYRSITKAHKVVVSNKTVLIGRNNEGKSNLLRALEVGMIFLQQHATRPRVMRMRRDEGLYSWERDFPIGFQNRKSGTQTIIRLEFLLDEEEILEFKEKIKSSLNGTLPILVKIGKNNIPDIKVSKKGKGSRTLNAGSGTIAEFIAHKIDFNYIPAVRTDQEAMAVVSRMLAQQLRFLEEQPEYVEAIETIKEIQQPVLDRLSNRIMQPLSEFLPGIKDVSIEIPENTRRNFLRTNFDIIVDDGTATKLSFKGDGVKSLAALGLLKDRGNRNGASIVAIEEPESHLHPAAIHQLNEVIQSLVEENQVIVSTHNPLFVDRKDIKSNIIVDSGKALPAKTTRQIRELLGIKASDNLINASYVLVVEGKSDVIALEALLKHLSESIKKLIDNNMLILEEIGGAGNLPYKLTTLKNSLCVYHCFLDNDEAGNIAYKAAEDDGLLTIKSSTMVNCNGSRNSELEDCFNLDVYKETVIDEYGVDLDHKRFHDSNKWSERVRNVFLDQGKRWDPKIESEIKTLVANCVSESPESSLNQYKRNSIDALVKNIEDMTEG